MHVPDETSRTLSPAGMRPDNTAVWAFTAVKAIAKETLFALANVARTVMGVEAESERSSTVLDWPPANDAVQEMLTEYVTKTALEALGVKSELRVRLGVEGVTAKLGAAHVGAIADVAVTN